MPLTSSKASSYPARFTKAARDGEQFFYGAFAEIQRQNAAVQSLQFVSEGQMSDRQNIVVKIRIHSTVYAAPA